MDDYAKVRCGRDVRSQLVDAEMCRLRGFVATVLDATPYARKSRRYVPSLLSLRPHELLDEFLAAARAEGVDVRWDGEAGCCVVHITAPGSPAECSPPRTAPWPYTPPAARRRA